MSSSSYEVPFCTKNVKKPLDVSKRRQPTSCPLSCLFDKLHPLAKLPQDARPDGNHIRSLQNLADLDSHCSCLLESSDCSIPAEYFTTDYRSFTVYDYSFTGSSVQNVTSPCSWSTMATSTRSPTTNTTLFLSSYSKVDGQHTPEPIRPLFLSSPFTLGRCTLELALKTPKIRKTRCVQDPIVYQLPEDQIQKFAAEGTIDPVYPFTGLAERILRGPPPKTQPDGITSEIPDNESSEPSIINETRDTETDVPSTIPKSLVIETKDAESDAPTGNA
ncbi:hypothetical protein QBC46DRAFT_447521 [Diplogelasinospora grovesii]|uniref:Uncharacterized protein n=1 Tax=Diplogelasinospora grovesii TaxID=303347 RepID=A0AAN6NBH3_9PEZI|nr:hypothetical protein QBC46DRAFT_447521 [Diplogelasinospora grovesii]